MLISIVIKLHSFFNLNVIHLLQPSLIYEIKPDLHVLNIYRQFATNTNAKLSVGMMTSSQPTNASESINITFPVVFTSKQRSNLLIFFRLAKL